MRFLLAERAPAQYLVTIFIGWVARFFVRRESACGKYEGWKFVRHSRVLFFGWLEFSLFRDVSTVFFVPVN